MTDDMYAPGDAQGRVSMAQWHEIAATDPTLARQLHSEGKVDFPEHLKAAMRLNRAEQKPWGYRSADDHAAHMQRLQERAGLSLEDRQARLEAAQADTGPSEMSQELTAAESEAEADRVGITEPISHTEWTELSRTDPEAAMIAHRAGRVNFPPEIAKQLAVNRGETRLGGR